MRSLFDVSCSAGILARLRRLRPDTRPLWGRMTAPRMVVHLVDQMRMTHPDARCTRMPGILRYPGIKHAVLYWLPWPKGRIQGPPEAFVTKPADWDADLARLETLVAQFVERGPGGTWPDHSYFGAMNGRQWGVFCYRHFDHHLRQFGV